MTNTYNPIPISSDRHELAVQALRAAYAAAGLTYTPAVDTVKAALEDLASPNAQATLDALRAKENLTTAQARKILTDHTIATTADDLLKRITWKPEELTDLKQAIATARAELRPHLENLLDEAHDIAQQLPTGDDAFNPDKVIATNTGAAYTRWKNIQQPLSALASLWSQAANSSRIGHHGPALTLITIPDVGPALTSGSTIINPNPQRDGLVAAMDTRRAAPERLLLGWLRGEWGVGEPSIADTRAEHQRRCTALFDATFTRKEDIESYAARKGVSVGSLLM